MNVCSILDMAMADIGTKTSGNSSISGSQDRGESMPRTTITIHFDGAIPLDTFTDAMQRFRTLVNALTKEVSGRAEIEWIIHDLRPGSATATIRGEAPALEPVERVVSAYSVVGHALERGEVIPYSPRVVGAASNLTAILNGKITSIRFETDADSSLVYSGSHEQSRAYVSAFGSVEGRIQTLTSRNRYGFTLYDSLDDRAVNCKLREDQAELVRGAWGKRVIVEGWIKREPVRGRPVEIGPVENITVLPEVVPGSYRRARGISPARIGDPPPAEMIRRIRDAQ
jgi:hypothetical protein